MKFLRARLFSFGLILSVAFLFLVSLVVTTALAATGMWIETNWPDSIIALFQTVSVLVSLLTITVLFAMMFKWLPDARIKWRDVWVGAFVSALLFEIGKSGLGHYFGRAELGAWYGAAGSMVLILLWFSYSAMLLFYGAEFTKVYAIHFHRTVSADEHALKAVKQGL